MKLIALSSSSKLSSEIKEITGLFDHGLEILHVRKPKFSTQAMEEYISLIPEHYRDRVMIHSKHRLAAKYKLRGVHLTRSHRKRKLKTWLNLKYIKAKNPNLKISTSFHTLEDLSEEKEQFDYVFLSPVFDSLSKGNYQGKFSNNNLDVIFEGLNQQVIALGGIDVDKVAQVKQMGFAGMALHGALWESDKPVQIFIKAKEACKNLTGS